MQAYNKQVGDSISVGLTLPYLHLKSKKKTEVYSTYLLVKLFLSKETE